MIENDVSGNRWNDLNGFKFRVLEKGEAGRSRLELWRQKDAEPWLLHKRRGEGTSQSQEHESWLLIWSNTMLSIPIVYS